MYESVVLLSQYVFIVFFFLGQTFYVSVWSKYAIKQYCNFFRWILCGHRMLRHIHCTECTHCVDVGTASSTWRIYLSQECGFVPIKCVCCVRLSALKFNCLSRNRMCHVQYLRTNGSTSSFVYRLALTSKQTTTK